MKVGVHRKNDFSEEFDAPERMADYSSSEDRQIKSLTAIEAV